MSTPLDTYRDIRIDKANRLRKLGLNPYPSDAHRTEYARRIGSDFDELVGHEVTIAGRVMSWREHRNLIFADIQDESGQAQVMLTQQKLPATDAALGTLGFADVAHLCDIGDLIEVRGRVIRTRRGEPSVEAEAVRMLAKSLRPMPDKWNKITDERVLVRQRYLDMIVNPQKREKFRVVSELQFAIRSFLRDRGFVEFNTPVLQPMYGGGRAKPFKTHLNALSRDYYLAISHELYLKRLIIAGFERVYTIGRYFRNEGIDRTHNPEFSMLETMTAFENYTYNMDLTESLYKHLLVDVMGKRAIRAGGVEIDMLGEWRRASMVDLVREHTGADFRAVRDLDSANQLAADVGVGPAHTVGHALANVFDARVAPELVQPTIVYGHPVEISPLAKATAEDERYVERFELFINGTEQGDNWSELNDPLELARRFEAEQQRRRMTGDEEAHPIDTEFLEAMEYGMPPTTGLGPGIERLAMLLTESEAISDVSFFPLLRPLQQQTAFSDNGDGA